MYEFDQQATVPAPMDPATTARTLSMYLDVMKSQGASSEILAVSMAGHVFLAMHDEAVRQLESIPMQDRTGDSFGSDVVTELAISNMIAHYSSQIAQLLQIRDEIARDAQLPPKPPGQDMFNVMAGRAPDDNG